MAYILADSVTDATETWLPKDLLIQASDDDIISNASCSLDERTGEPVSTPPLYFHFTTPKNISKIKALIFFEGSQSHFLHATIEAFYGGTWHLRGIITALGTWQELVLTGNVLTDNIRVVVYRTEGDYTGTWLSVIQELLAFEVEPAEYGDETGTGICTLADVKRRLGISNTDDDILINQIIAGIDAIFDSETLRTLLITAADITEYFTGGGPYLLLPRYPVVNITSIKEAFDYDFDSADALAANTDYVSIAGGEKGTLFRIGFTWSATPASIKVVYRGGFCPAGETPAAGEFAMPADLREAAIMQSSFIYKRKNDLGLSSVSFQGGSVSKFADIELLPLVKSTLNKYRRASL